MNINQEGLNNSLLGSRSEGNKLVSLILVLNKRGVSPTYSLLHSVTMDVEFCFALFKLFCFALRYTDCDLRELKSLWKTSMTLKF